MAITPEFCFILDGKGGGHQIDIDDMPENSKKPMWIHMDYKDAENQEWIQKLELDERVEENLLAEDTSPRYFAKDNGLLVVMRGVNTQKSADIDDMITLHLWIEKNRILTLCHRPIPAVRYVRSLLKKGQGPESPVWCFIELAKDMTKQIERAIARIDDEVDEVEEAVIEEESYRNKPLRTSLSQLRHKIVGLRRYIVPQRDTIKVMKNISHPLLDEDALNQLREIHMDLTEAVQDLDFARDHSAVTQEQLNSKTNINISQTMYAMSIVMVIFTPLTFMTGLLGANIGGIPFAESEYGFIIITLFLLLIGIFQLFLLKRMKWF